MSAERAHVYGDVCIARGRIAERVCVNESGCWIWQRALDADGYGRISIGGRKSRIAPRVSCEAYIGEIGKGLELDHLCRVHACVNPWHLEPVTHAENVRRGIAGAMNRARMLARTHCRSKHKYTPENTRIGSKGERYCLTCKREWIRNKRQSVKAVA